MDRSNVHNYVSPNPHVAASEFTPTTSGQQFYQPPPPPPPYFRQNIPPQPEHRSQPQQQDSAAPPYAITGEVPENFLQPVQQAMDQIHQIARKLQIDARLATLFLSSGEDQFHGLVRRIATEALLSGIYGVRFQVERVKFYNAPDDTFGIQDPINNVSVGNSQHLERMCEQAWADDDGAAGQAEEGCGDAAAGQAEEGYGDAADDGDDFARMCEAVWDAGNPEESTMVDPS